MSSRVYSATERAAEAAAMTEDSAHNEEKIPDFPGECLPPILEREAREISKLCGVPVGMAAPMVLCTGSIAIGRSLRVRSLPGRSTHANLFVLVCKTSGSGGSLTFKYATAPLQGMQKTLRREFEGEQKPRLEAQLADVSAQIEKLKKELKDGIGAEDREQIIADLAKLIAKRTEIETNKGKLVWATDVTPEILAQMLAEHGETLAHIDPDAADALGIITGERYGDGKHTQESVWLKGYTGEPTVIFRKHGDPVHLIAPCLAVLFVTTPDKLQELFRKSRLTSGGLLPRFLVCDPAARPVPLEADTDIRHTLPTDVSQPYESAIFEAIHQYRFLSVDDSYEIEMTSAARHLFVKTGIASARQATELRIARSKRATLRTQSASQLCFTRSSM